MIQNKNKMSKQNLCGSKYFPGIVAILILGMVIQIIRAGIDFGQWLYAIMH